jgi:electron transfer flavoprotein-quinone oxidoreductase
MEKIDVVIVGGGLSGLSCAYRLAETDLQVLVVERGDFPGSKNVTGGRLYVMPLKPLAGDMLEGAPFERKVVRERWSLLGESRSLNVDLFSEKFLETDHSFTVLRAVFDRWLADRLAERGVFVIPKYRVDDLLWEGNSVAGVKAGEEEIWANVVVAADGVLSFMAEKAGLRPGMKPGNYAVGIKEIIELPEDKINDRFNVEKGEGSAQLFIGDVTKGLFGGGFLYTNRESLSLGIVAGIKAVMERSPTLEVHSLMDAFKERPEMKRLLEGGNVAEYSAHIIPEAGQQGVSRLCRDGMLVTGDAAGFAVNLGVTVRGMEFAIASGIAAAETILKAREAGDYSEKNLSSYGERLKETFVLKDLQAAAKMPGFLDNDAFFNLYPRTFPELLEKIMWFGEGPREKMGKTLWEGLKSSGLITLRGLKDLYGLKDI